MKKLNMNVQKNINGGAVYMYTALCGGCLCAFAGYSETMIEAEHGYHLSTKKGKKCFGRGLLPFIKIKLF